jgi:hypothetical protein
MQGLHSMRRFMPAVLGCFLSWQAAAAQSSVNVLIDLAQAGPLISSNFIGLSYETALILPGRNGRHFFSSENRPLVQMFRSLGIQNLRVGGNTAERESVAIPGLEDIDSLFGFASAAGVKVIYTLPLYRGEPGADGAIAKYVLEHYKAELTCFCLGNEPDKTNRLADYRDLFRRFVTVITSPTNAPEAKFCGPSATHKNVAWARQFTGDFGHDGRIVLITQHEYPARSGLHIANTTEAADRLLSSDLCKTYNALYGQFVPAARSNGLPYRLEEANSFSNGGAPGVSDAFAAALWGLDYLYWWAEHGASGLNFHTGGSAPGNPARAPMKYAVFWNSDDGFAARPLAYAIKAFALADDGRLAPARVSAEPGPINLTAYAVVTPKNSLYVTLINKEHGPGHRDAAVNLSVGRTYARAEAMFLRAPGGDIAAKSGVTLGGASFQNDGTWQGTWTALEAAKSNGQLTLVLPAASAVVVKLADN